MSWRLAELFVMVPPFGVLGRAQQQLEMNCLHCIAGRILKFMVKLLLIMCCSCCAASLMRTAAEKVNNIESYMKITYEEVHYIDPLHYISSISNFHAHTSSYKLSPLHVARRCAWTCLWQVRGPLMSLHCPLGHDL